MHEAKKLDQGKPMFTAMPTHAIEQMMQVMTFGATKYGKYNFLYNGGLEPSRLVDALFRHILAWWHEEKVDPESGKSHLAHVMCCAGMLLEYDFYQYTKDDRFRKEMRLGNDLYDFKWGKDGMLEVHFKKNKRKKK